MLLSNGGVLPWQPSALAQVAVIGHNARDARTQGGGSATVLPERVVSPLDGDPRGAARRRGHLRSSARSCRRAWPRCPLEQLTNPRTGEPGARVAVPATPTAPSSSPRTAGRRALVWFGGDAPIERGRDGRAAHHATPPTETGAVLLGFATGEHGRGCTSTAMLVRRRQARDRRAPTSVPRSSNPPSVTAAVARRGRAAPVDVRAEFDLGRPAARLAGVLSVDVGIAPDDSDPEGLIAEAAVAAPRQPTSPSSWSAPTRRSSPRATTARTSTCPAVRTTSCAPSRPRTRARS